MNDNKINNNIAKNYKINYSSNFNNKNEIAKIKTNIQNTVNKVIEEMNFSLADDSLIEDDTNTGSVVNDIGNFFRDIFYSYSKYHMSIFGYEKKDIKYDHGIHEWNNKQYRIITFDDGKQIWFDEETGKPTWVIDGDVQIF